MRTDAPTIARSGHRDPSTASVRDRMQRIIEDIEAAESKIERIRNRIERDRQALLHWQARLPGRLNEIVRLR
jgi:hypothetical protein